MTRVRRTSAAVYHRIEAEGLLSKARFRVYACLYHHGPLTGAEVDQRLVGSRGHYHKRLPELRDQGAIEEVGERVCSVTGETVIAWDVTDAIPSKLVKAPKTSHLSKGSLAALRKVWASVAPADKRAIERTVELLKVRA